MSEDCVYKVLYKLNIKIYKYKFYFLIEINKLLPE